MRSSATGYDRRMYQRLLVTTRGYQKRWRAEEAMRRATRQGRNYRNTRMGRTSPLARITGRAQKEVSKRACAEHWRKIVGHGDTTVDTTDFPTFVAAYDPEEDSLTTTALDFLTILGKMKVGNSGSTDGVVAEFVQALSPD